MDKAPDIIYRTEDMRYQSHRYFEFGSNKLFSRTHNTESGHHRMEGIFLASGPSFGEGEITKAEILDLAPTLLHALGYAVPDDMDGRVMHEVLGKHLHEARKDGGMEV